MQPQEIGLLVLPVILLFAVVINYFDRGFKVSGGQSSRRHTDSRDDPSASS